MRLISWLIYRYKLLSDRETLCLMVLHIIFKEFSRGTIKEHLRVFKLSKSVVRAHVRMQIGNGINTSLSIIII